MTVKDTRGDTPYIIAISGAALAVIVFLANVVFNSTEQRKHDATCERVLHCLDEGVTRDHCDTLYPGCEAGSEP